VFEKALGWAQATGTLSRAARCREAAATIEHLKDQRHDDSADLCGQPQLGETVQDIHKTGQVTSRIELDELSDPLGRTIFHCGSAAHRKMVYRALVRGKGPRHHQILVIYGALMRRTAAATTHPLCIGLCGIPIPGKPLGYTEGATVWAARGILAGEMRDQRPPGLGQVAKLGQCCLRLG